MDTLIAEFVGTSLLITMGSGVVANVVLNKTKGNNAGWMVITTAWALGVFIGVVVAGPHSGAHLNPAVTIAMTVFGGFPRRQVLPWIGAQMLGAFVAAAVATALAYLNVQLKEKNE